MQKCLQPGGGIVRFQTVFEGQGKKIRGLEIREKLKKKLVGPTGFEPATFCTPSKRATSLRYGPTKSVSCWSRTAGKIAQGGA